MKQQSLENLERWSTTESRQSICPTRFGHQSHHSTRNPSWASNVAEIQTQNPHCEIPQWILKNCCCLEDLAMVDGMVELVVVWWYDPKHEIAP
jgi:hypothetical protein